MWRKIPGSALVLGGFAAAPMSRTPSDLMLSTEFRREGESERSFVEVWQPTHYAGDWYCPVRIGDLGDEPVWVRGVDAVDALMGACRVCWAYLAPLLRVGVREGSTAESTEERSWWEAPPPQKPALAVVSGEAQLGIRRTNVVFHQPQAGLHGSWWVHVSVDANEPIWGQGEGPLLALVDAARSFYQSSELDSVRRLGVSATNLLIWTSVLRLPSGGATQDLLGCRLDENDEIVRSVWRPQHLGEDAWTCAFQIVPWSLGIRCVRAPGPLSALLMAHRALVAAEDDVIFRCGEVDEYFDEGAVEHEGDRMEETLRIGAEDVCVWMCPPRRREHGGWEILVGCGETRKRAIAIEEGDPLEVLQMSLSLLGSALARGRLAVLFPTHDNT